MAINSKHKGNKYEREIAKWLSDWTGYEFNRVPQSGGLRWKKADNITSDVICTDPDHVNKFPFSIECKSYKEIDFSHVILEKKTSVVDKFWDQAKSDAERGGKLPLLFMKYNRMSKGVYFVVTDISLPIPLEPSMTIKTSKININVYLSTNLIKVKYRKVLRAIKKS